MYVCINKCGDINKIYMKFYTNKYQLAFKQHSKLTFGNSHVQQKTKTNNNLYSFNLKLTNTQNKHTNA